MGDTTVKIAAPPERVFGELIKKWEEAVPGTMKAGDHFMIPGQNVVFTVNTLEPPTRFGLSWVYEKMTFIADYTVLPDAGGSLVRVEMDQRDVYNPLGLAFSALTEGKRERELLEELKRNVEGSSAAV
jgi:hypothetical protein